MPHGCLLLKLEFLGIRGNLLCWFNSFLPCRFQQVVVGGQYSEWSPVISGVTQGSVLGPLLFIRYVDDLCSVINHSSIKFFADDITIFKEINNLDDCSALQKDLDAVLDWSSKWLLRLNPDKCAALSITNKCHTIMHTYQLNGHPIIWSPVIRYLGVIYLIISKVDRPLFTHCKESFKYLELYSSCCLHAPLKLVLLPLNVWCDPSLNMLARFGTLTWLKTFKCLRLFKTCY